MNMQTQVQNQQKNELNKAVTRRVVQVLGFLLLQGLILFASAGRFNWAGAWAYLGLYLAIITINALILVPKDPELIAERGRTGGNAKPWDKVITTIVSALTVAYLILAGLDARFAWSGAFPAGVQVAAGLLMLLGFLLVTWAMASNRFFSTVVRIQADRDHQVISSGPYHFVRHPGYIGLTLSGLVVPLLLGSWWALIPGLLTSALSIVRTALEDKTLQAELPGYAEYAARVRYRLLPGIW